MLILTLWVYKVLTEQDEMDLSGNLKVFINCPWCTALEHTVKEMQALAAAAFS